VEVYHIFLELPICDGCMESRWITFHKSSSSGSVFLQVVEDMASRCNFKNFEFFVLCLRKFGLNAI
jgi:hypothetical protein